MTTDPRDDRRPDPHLGAHLDRFGDALSAAAARRAGGARAAADVRGGRAPHRPLLVSVGAAGLAGVAVVIAFAASPGDAPVDVLGRAQAALEVRGELVHYRVRSTSGKAVGRGIDLRVGPGGPGVDGPCRPTAPVEVWQAVDPVRWRVIRPAPPRGRRCGGLGDDRGPIRGPQEESFADDALSYYLRERDTLRIVSGYDPRGSASRLSVGPVEGLAREDPVGVLRRLLRLGRVTDRGERTVDGRRVRTFAGSRNVPVRFGARSGESTPFRETTVYDVDPETYAPLRVVRTHGVPVIDRTTPGRGRGRLVISRVRTYASQLDFVAFDRRPLDAEARRKLMIRPARPATVARLTQERFRAQITAAGRREERRARERYRRERGD